jgi:hypothetical protein
MSEKYKFLDPSGMYFVTSTIVGWADVFTRPDMKHTIVESLRYCQQNKGLLIHGWCLMPSHLHMIISTVGESLSDSLRLLWGQVRCDLTSATTGPLGSAVEWGTRYLILRSTCAVSHALQTRASGGRTEQVWNSVHFDARQSQSARLSTRPRGKHVEVPPKG